MHKVIFDTDPGVDDAMALLFLHRHPEIDLIGITTVFGNASVETTTRNALFLKREWGIAAPVAKGEGKTWDPMRNPVDWPVLIHGHDGLGNIDVPETIDLPIDGRPAHRFIIDTVRANPGEVTLIAVGRMSNLAVFAFNSYKSPGVPPEPSIDRAWTAALVLILIVMALNLGARLAYRRFGTELR